MAPPAPPLPPEFASNPYGNILRSAAFLLRGPKSLRLTAERHQPAQAA